VLVKIAADTLRQIRSVLEKTAELEKKSAELQRDNDVYKRTLELVARGHIDPEIALDKVAEFKSDVDRLRIFEVAVELGSQETTKLGTAVDAVSENSSGGDSPEGKYARRLRETADELGVY